MLLLHRPPFAPLVLILEQGIGGRLAYSCLLLQTGSLSRLGEHWEDLSLL